MATQRESSRQNWNSNQTIQDINSGSLQRIADANELMAKNHLKPQQDCNYYEKEINKYRELFYAEQRKNSALRGVITKLKSKTIKQS